MKINCTSIDKKKINNTVTLYGWVARKRDLGNLVFIDLRDRSGIIQLTINQDSNAYEIASKLKIESVIKAVGKVIERKEANPNLKTGEIEIETTEI